jgi:hypothetical protein
MINRAWLFLCVAGFAATCIGQTQESAVDQLIPWLLDEDRQLRGIPWNGIIFDSTGKKVLPFDSKNEIDHRVVKGISAACDETMKRLNAPNSPIQAVARINEVSSHFEDTLRERLGATPGLNCDFPTTAEGKVQRSGYPDLRIVDLSSKRVYYLDPKLYSQGSRESSFRAFTSNRKWRPIKCATMQSISSPASNTNRAKSLAPGNLRVGTLSIFPPSK